MNLLNIKKHIIRIILLQASKFSAISPVKNLKRIVALLEILASRKDRQLFRKVRNTLSEENPQFQLYRRILVESNSTFRDKFITNLIVQGFILNLKKRHQALKEGLQVPTTILISPTMRCNLSCFGCYAGSYTKKEDLEFETVDRIIQEGKEIGVAFFTILGGEPFIRDDLFHIYKKHNDVFFNVFTNGTMLDENTVGKLVELGNVMSTLSIEGFKEETDQRRGKEVYEKVLKTMEILKTNKIPFGYSVTVTKRNIDIVTSDEFIDMMINKGAIIGWYFLYMPIGRNPDLSLMPTPAQRLYLKEKRDHIRENKPLFIIDFWNDAPYVGGCIAAKEYMHINHKGDVEPCIFTHFAGVNIKNTSLKNALNCQFFKEIRKRQPYSDNLYLPCMLIDNPQISRELYKNCKIYPTHEGAECLFSDIAGKLDEYSKNVRDIYDEVWAKEKKFLAKKPQK
ncbi:MAG: radical SAM protein [Actinomycetota bacterium]|nr:radical SAM protein [Actinomycetota bacterium]